jgi:hypothetical protein
MERRGRWRWRGGGNGMLGKFWKSGFDFVGMIVAVAVADRKKKVKKMTRGVGWF